ncbi:MAG: protein-disulfide reductase DsbD family protein [Flavobacteriales bacterium]
MFSPLITFLAFFATAASPVQWNVSAVAAVDGTVVVHCDARLEPGWHIYATQLSNDMGPLPTAFRLAEGSTDRLLRVDEPTPVEEYDPNFGMVVRYHDGTPRFTLHTTAKATAPLSGEVEYMLCNDKTCLPPTVYTFTVSAAAEPTDE